jgi:hypothetical protein
VIARTRTRYDSDWQDFSSQLQTYIKNNPSVAAQYAAITDPAKWANESFQYVRTDVYNFDPTGTLSCCCCCSPTRALSPPDTAVGRITESRVTDLGEAYYNQNLPIIKQRLVAAGVRLGALINSIFSSSRVRPRPTDCTTLTLTRATQNAHVWLSPTDREAPHASRSGQDAPPRVRTQTNRRSPECLRSFPVGHRARALVECVMMKQKTRDSRRRECECECVSAAACVVCQREREGEECVSGRRGTRSCAVGRFLLGLVGVAAVW